MSGIRNSYVVRSGLERWKRCSSLRASSYVHRSQKLSIDRDRQRGGETAAQQMDCSAGYLNFADSEGIGRELEHGQTCRGKRPDALTSCIDSYWLAVVRQIEAARDNNTAHERAMLSIEYAEVVRAVYTEVGRGEFAKGETAGFSVMVVRQDRARSQAVTLGSTYADQIAVSGMQPGELVISAGASLIAEGERVEGIR